MRAVSALVLCVLSCLASGPLESRLDRQMKFWQKRLGLEEWNLSLRVVRQSQIDPDSWGTAEWYPESKTGVINVLDPRDYNLKGGNLKQDMECTIVHELVHIQVSPLKAEDAAEREEVVNKIMAAVLNRACPN
jgi:hypothetical protein